MNADRRTSRLTFAIFVCYYEIAKWNTNGYSKKQDQAVVSGD